MLKSFRVVDLRELFIGKEKKGLKGDLIRRAIQLIQNECSQELLTKINDIYNSRCQPQAVTNPRASPQILSMKIADSTPSPSSQDSDVKLMSFPFHQTLDILIDLTALSMVIVLHIISEYYALFHVKGFVMFIGVPLSCQTTLERVSKV